MSQSSLESPPSASDALPEVSPRPAASIVRAVAELQSRLAPFAAERDRSGGIPREEVDVIRQSELHGLAVPVEHGGLGGSISTILWAVRKIGEVDGGVSRLFGYHLLIGLWIRLLGGTPKQQAFYYGQVIRERAWLGNASLEGGTSVDTGHRHPAHEG